MSRIRKYLRKFTKYLFLGCLLLVLLISAFLWYITTQSFQETVRGRLVAAIERASGGRAELGSFHVVPLRFQVEVRDLTIHGREAAGQVPLVHVDSMSAVVNLSSVLGAKIAFQSLTLRHPVVHVIFYPDGSTNQPTPKQNVQSFEQLFSIGINRLDVKDGELLWQDDPIPLQFVTNDVSATLDYSFLHRRYSGTVAVGKAQTQFDGLRPFAWTGQAGFAISSTGIEINSLSMSSEKSQLRAKGVITGFNNPTFNGSYDLVLDLQQAGIISRQPDLKLGSAEVKGNGSWSRQTFSSDGALDISKLSFSNRNLILENASGAGKFAVTPEEVSISEVHGELFGGRFAGEGKISGWQTQQSSAKRSIESQSGMFKLRSVDIELAKVLKALGPPFPVNQLKYSGNVSGATEVRWKHSMRDAEITATLDVKKPDRIRSGDIPITATLQGTYAARPNHLQVNNFVATTPATQVHASGAMSPGSQLKLSFATSDLREWQPLTSALFPAGMPVAVNGRAVFNGSATGELSNPVFTGNLQLQDFDTLISGQLSGQLSGQDRLHWDSLVSDVQASSRQLVVHNALLHSGPSTIRLDGTVGLRAWNIGPDSAMHLRADVQNADAGQFAKLGRVPVRLQGRLSGNGEFSGTVSNPEGQGTLTLLNGSIEGHAFDSATSFIQYR